MSKQQPTEQQVEQPTEQQVEQPTEQYDPRIDSPWAMPAPKAGV